jgi:L-ascorbate metabolism protein UlaG (beta-lactamase superfamily)
VTQRPRGPGSIGAVQDQGPSITWVGHSTVLLELDGVRLLTDPVLRERMIHLRRVSGSADIGALHDVDALLVSHLHYDHLDVKSLRVVGRASRVVVPVGAGDMLRSRGFAHVTELEVGDDTDVKGVNVSATHAEHGGRQVLGMRVPALGYLVSGSVRIWFAGDTDLFDGMSHVARDLDVALLPVAGWGPRVPRGHLNPERAAQALTLLHPRIAVPIHWGTYRRVGLPSGEDVLREPAESFARIAAEVAPEVDVRILPVGGRLELTGVHEGASA